MILLFVLLVITFIVNFDTNVTHYIGIIVQLSAAFFSISILSWNDFKDRYCFVIFIIAFYSLLLTAYFNINIGAVGNLPIYGIDGSSETMWHTFHNIYYTWGWSPWTTILRNSGCFREPGVFGIILNIALMFKIFDIIKKGNKYDKKEYITLMIYIIAIVSTFSTTAILCLGLCITIYFLSIRKFSLKTLALLCVFVFVALYFVVPREDLLFSKFDSSSESYNSSLQRYLGTMDGLNKWSQNPLFGVGFAKYSLNMKGTSANSFVDILGKYGLFFCMMIVYALLKWLKSIAPNYLLNLGGCLILIFALASQNMILMPIFIVFEFYGIDSNMRIAR